MELITPVIKKQRVSRVKKSQMANIKDPNTSILSNEPLRLPTEPTTPSSPNTPQVEEPKVLKRRGRKPKGGKIVPTQLPINSVTVDKPNILIHLKCSLQDLHLLEKNTIGTYQFTPNNISIEFLKLEQNTPDNQFNDNYFLLEPQTDNYTVQSEQQFTFTNSTPLTYSTNIPPQSLNISTPSVCSNSQTCKCETTAQLAKKLLCKKINDLSVNLHKNNIDKKSACFWCTYDFDTPVIYIPKYNILDQYYVYGCFCAPECAFAYLMNENIDTATKFERYQLLNYIYKSLYNYTNNIKPAPNPYYMLDKFYGNLSIQEYRSLFQTDRLFLIVDKPLTKMMPELVEDNDEFILNKKLIPSGNYQIKRGSTKKNENKKDILTEHFHL
jgi:hypothetical protein